MTRPVPRAAPALIAWSGSESLSWEWKESLADARDALEDDGYLVYVLQPSEVHRANLVVAAFLASDNGTEHAGGVVARALGMGAPGRLVAMVACGPSEPPVVIDDVRRHAPQGHGVEVIRIEEPAGLAVHLKGWVASNARLLGAEPPPRINLAPAPAATREEDLCEIDRRAF